MLENLGDLLRRASERNADATALRFKGAALSYGELLDSATAFARGLVASGIERNDRVAIFADKQFETVISMMGTSLAGGVFVPVNGLLRPAQVSYILNDCNVRTLVTTAPRLAQLGPVLSDCPDLRSVILMSDDESTDVRADVAYLAWNEVTGSSDVKLRQPAIGSDMAAIMYTSGSTGMPKGVVLSHLNMLVGATSVATYIENVPQDRILAILPLSFDAGLSQITTGFYSGACVVLHNHLLARDVVRIVEKESITGITAVPPLWMQITDQQWPKGSADSVRYFANTGGKMPGETLSQLRQIFTNAKPFLMYGLTEAFRSTYLPPSEVDTRPDSIGKAIPNAEILVVGKDGTICEPGAVGELVHRGPLVALGYWNDPERTAHRFKPAPGQPPGLPNPELAVWSGDSVKTDEEGFLYFVSRMDEMIKTSGYRVSPAEIEEIAYDTGLVSEVAALGITHPRLAQAIVLVAKAKHDGDESTDDLLAKIKAEAPNFMVPHAVFWKESLPRNANGKLDRRLMAEEFKDLFSKEPPE